MRSLWAWLLDVACGPHCQMPGCRYRARGWRTFGQHILDAHGDEATS